MQFALAGINAHINRDLPEAILAACQVTSTRPPDRGDRRYADFLAINETLHTVIEEVKNTLDVRGSQTATSIAEWNVVSARESAWQNAERPDKLSRLPLLGDGFLVMLDGLAAVLGKTLLVPTIADMFPYDSALLTVVQTIPQNIPEVLGILQTIDATCADADGLKWFNWLYLQVTAAVEARVSAGGFADPAWLAELDVQFASLYFSALKAWLGGERATPGCWQVLFCSRDQNAIARIQFVLAGMNAHIDHDLPEAILATCQVTGTIPNRGGIHYVDYTALNSTLDSLIQSAKTTLNVRLPGDSLPPVTHLEDTIAAWDVSAARESAWQNAGHLNELGKIPLLADSFMDMLDGLTTVIGKTLLVPVPGESSG